MNCDAAPGWPLDPDVVFLNHGSFGSCPRPVLAEQTRWRQRFESAPMRYFVREIDDVLDAARARVASFVGAAAADVVFVPNATTGVNVVLRSLALAPGDEVLTTSHAYGACARALRTLAERQGARVVVAELPFPLQSVQPIIDAVLGAASERTRLCLLDHVTSPTGLVLPVGELVAALEGRGIATLIDGAHAPGMLELDVAAIGASYYVGNFHKWVCTPKGCAFLHVREDRQAGIEPLIISHGASKVGPDCARSAMQLELGWSGTRDVTAFLCAPAAIDAMAGALDGGWPAVRARNHALALEGREILLEAIGAARAPCPATLCGGSLAAVLLDGAGAAPSRYIAGFDALYDRLLDEFAIEAIVYGWPAAGARILRLSAQLYNERADYEALATALGQLELRAPANV
ncbi:MAG: aminotransferase class V-fold PLP-dependent enzyme [Myxococcales bacterium]|nr:aminotransferase class V-fold PLP-dependent enzyme [Myxococcales bacterium]